MSTNYRDAVSAQTVRIELTYDEAKRLTNLLNAIKAAQDREQGWMTVSVTISTSESHLANQLSMRTTRALERAEAKARKAVRTVSTPTFAKGDRVNTPGGLGTVVYVRMLPLDYTRITSVSVALDKDKDKPQYVGTIYVPSAVTKVTP